MSLTSARMSNLRDKIEEQAKKEAEEDIQEAVKKVEVKKSKKLTK